MVLSYMDCLIEMFRTGGFSADLTHHVMHARGSRMLGFTQELFVDTPSADPVLADPDLRAAMVREMTEKYPYVAEMAMAATHEDDSIIGSGCDDQFEFALDLLLGGFERLHQRGWPFTAHAPSGERG